MQSNLIIILNDRMASSSLLIKIIPILWDIFVFSYPIFLIRFYFSQPEHISWWKRLWIREENYWNKTQALSILLSFFTVIIVNYIVKAFIPQPRPIHILDLSINPQSSLLLDHIPTDAFPSDHAAVSMVIALMTLIISYKYGNKKIRVFWRIFIIFALIMSISRIIMWLHRPIDIFWGILTAIITSLLLTCKPIEDFLSHYIYTPVVQFQEYIFGIIKK